MTDVDSPDFDGGQLVVTIAAGGEAEDRLYVNSEGTGPGQVSASGASVSYNDGGGSVVIGTLSGGYSAGDPLVITFNVDATADGVVFVGGDDVGAQARQRPGRGRGEQGGESESQFHEATVAAFGFRPNDRRALA